MTDLTNSFRKILIPVDLSFNTEVAVKKCMELADNSTEVHLLYVQPFHSGRWLRRRGKNYSVNGDALKSKMEEWKLAIEKHTRGISVCAWSIMANSIENSIIEKAIQLKVDLIIIGKTSRHSRLSFLNTVTPSRIARQAGVAVLTAKPGSILFRTKIVIAPIATEIDKCKMTALHSICKKFKVKVYLVTFMAAGKSLPFDAAALMEVYQWLKTSVHCDVQFEVLHGTNKAKVILDYANRMDADVVIVNPQTETLLGWPNIRLTDVLPPDSKMQILSV